MLKLFQCKPEGWSTTGRIRGCHETEVSLWVAECHTIRALVNTSIASRVFHARQEFVLLSLPCHSSVCMAMRHADIWR